MAFVLFWVMRHAWQQGPLHRPSGWGLCFGLTVLWYGCTLLAVAKESRESGADSAYRYVRAQKSSLPPSMVQFYSNPMFNADLNLVAGCSMILLGLQFLTINLLPALPFEWADDLAEHTRRMVAAFPRIPQCPKWSQTEA